MLNTFFLFSSFLLASEPVSSPLSQIPSVLTISAHTDDQIEKKSYEMHYANLSHELYAQQYKEVWGTDIEMNNILSVEQIDNFMHWLDLNQNSKFLDGCCGNGGPLIYITAKTNCTSYGLDLSAQSIEIAKNTMTKKGVNIDFTILDLKQHLLPFEDSSIDAAVCIESILHFDYEERLKLFKEFKRVLKPNGKFIVTDPCVITGMISSDEIAQRSMYGKYIYTFPAITEKLLEESGLKVVKIENITENNGAVIPRKFLLIREEMKEGLLELEKEEFESTQGFFKICDTLYNSNRLSQYAYFLTN